MVSCKKIPSKKMTPSVTQWLSRSLTHRDIVRSCDFVRDNMDAQFSSCDNYYYYALDDDGIAECLGGVLLPCFNEGEDGKRHGGGGRPAW